MNASFGIDHPLLATHDIHRLRDRLISLGFNMTSIGKHPWGTSTSLAMFNGCLLEIMGIHDDTLIDEVPAGDFRFGRHVYEHLQLREGVALTALHSTNSVKDAQRAQDAGLEVAGHLEFGRDVTLPDGAKGRTKTTLALLPDAHFPRLSFFLCQQHRPDLIYVSQWLEHPNKVIGICGVNIIAKDEYFDTLKLRFGRLYGTAETIKGGFEFQTANGVICTMNADSHESTFGPLPDSVLQEPTPCIVGMDFITQNPQALLGFVRDAGLSYRRVDNGIALTCPELTANTFFRFYSE